MCDCHHFLFAMCGTLTNSLKCGCGTTQGHNKNLTGFGPRFIWPDSFGLWLYIMVWGWDVDLEACNSSVSWIAQSHFWASKMRLRYSAQKWVTCFQVHISSPDHDMSTRVWVHYAYIIFFVSLNKSIVLFVFVNHSTLSRNCWRYWQDTIHYPHALPSGWAKTRPAGPKRGTSRRPLV